MNPQDLLDQALHLAKRSSKRPRQADLKRAVSSAYYAVFHALCRTCADALIGVGTNRPEKAWLQVYRAIDHGSAKGRCRKANEIAFPVEIQTFALAFINLQEQRHRADYDPSADYSRTEVFVLIDLARQAVSELRASPPRDRKAFATHVLLPYRT